MTQNTTQQIDNIERIVKVIVEQSHKSSEMEQKWSDVVKQNLENIDKNKQIAADAKTLIEKSHQLRSLKKMVKQQWSKYKN